MFIYLIQTIHNSLVPEPPQYPQVQNSQPKSITVIFDPSEGGSDWYEAKCVPKGDDPDDYKYMRVSTLLFMQ